MTEAFPGLPAISEFFQALPNCVPGTPNASGHCPGPPKTSGTSHRDRTPDDLSLNVPGHSAPSLEQGTLHQGTSGRLTSLRRTFRAPSTIFSGFQRPPTTFRGLRALLHAPEPRREGVRQLFTAPPHFFSSTIITHDNRHSSALNRTITHTCSDSCYLTKDFRRSRASKKAASRNFRLATS